MDDKEPRRIIRGGYMSYRETQAEADARVCDADRLIGAGIVLLIAAGIAAVAVFAVPAAVWFLA